MQFAASLSTLSLSAQPNQLLAPFPVGSHTASDWLPVCNPGLPCENPAASRQGIRPVKRQGERRLEGLRVEEASMGVMVGDFWNSQLLPTTSTEGRDMDIGDMISQNSK
ncbi:hypothetical protein B0T20DRAFT_421703 [Sordaria brevicollis]|uniref:Uncharacterized protein n=1 Tax=Sordaria brevicollis TaxID=83679 RepID=A0AAE0P3G8_SORBR|nr:hypothetical protein B0T20DRAFT_421703 [Sordaria brevicollis]